MRKPIKLHTFSQSIHGSRFVLFIVVLLAVGQAAAFSQISQLHDSCNLNVTGGAGGAASFIAFDRELRVALKSEDPAAVALLVD